MGFYFWQENLVFFVGFDLWRDIFFLGGGGGIQLRRSKYFCINSPNAVQEQADFAEF